MENLENQEMPRRKVAPPNSPRMSRPDMVERRPVVEKPAEKGYSNSKIWSAILLLLAVAGLVCFFVLPIYSATQQIASEVIKTRIKLFDFLSYKGYKWASSLILVGYSVIIVNSLLNLWHDEEVKFKKIFLSCNLTAVVASLMTLICGAYLLFSVDFKPVMMITAALLVAVAVCQSLQFLSCKSINTERTFKNNKLINSLHLILLIVFIFFSWCAIFGEVRSTLRYDYVLQYIVIILCLYQIINEFLLYSNKIGCSKYGYASKVFAILTPIIYCVICVSWLYYPVFVREYRVMTAFSIFLAVLEMVAIWRLAKSKSNK